MVAEKELSREEVLALIKKKSYGINYLIDIPELYKADKSITLEVIQYNGVNYTNIPDCHKNDREILTAMAKSGKFDQLPEWIQDDDALARTAFQQNTYCFKHASVRLRGDRDFVVWALSQNLSANILEYISNPELLDDIEILKLAVKSHTQAYGYVPRNHRDNKELLEIVLSGKLENTLCFDSLPAQYRDDKAIALKAVSDDSYCFESLSDRLQDDEEIAILAVSREGRLLAHASDRIRDNKNVVMVIAKNGHLASAFKYISQRLQLDRELIIEALTIDNRALESIDIMFRKDRMVIEACMKNRQFFWGDCYEFFDKSFQEDLEITLRMSQGRDFPLKAVPGPLRQNREILRNAIVSDERNIKYVPESLLNDRDFVKELVFLNQYITKHMAENLIIKLLTTSVISPDHRGAKLIYRVVLDDGGYVQGKQRLVKLAEIIKHGELFASMADFPLLTYESDGPVGSYLSVRFMNDFILVGDFIFFVKENSGKETFSRHLSKEFNGGYAEEPQPNDDFLKHSVYLVPEKLTKIDYNNMSSCPLLYFGLAKNLPEGIRLFPNQNSFSEASTVLFQKQTYGDPSFRRVDETTLVSVPVNVAEIEGAARIFLDNYGWRFLLPHPDGAIAALEVLHSTSDVDDWNWLKKQSRSLTANQKSLLIAHFEGSKLADEVKAYCA